MLHLRCVFFLAAAIVISVANTCAAASTNDLTLVWSYKLPGAGTQSSPVVARDGTIYLGTFRGWLFAFSPQGKVRWKFKTGMEIKSSPAVAEDGTIYFGSRDRNFYALSPDGKLKWKFQTGGWVDSSPGIGLDGTVFFGSWDKNFYALTPGGNLKWSFATSNLITTSPAIAGDGTVYFGSHDNNFYALTPDGKLRWKTVTGGPIDISPAIAWDGTVYFGSVDGNFYALHPDGTEAWRLHTGSYTAAPPVLDAVGNLYLSANKNHLIVSPDGKLVWQWGCDVAMDMARLVSADGKIYGSVPWLHLGVEDRNGKLDWGFQMASNLASAPNVTPDGTVLGTDGGSLYDLRPQVPAVLEKSSWPMWRADPQHTGRAPRN
jgi:outer membrane protein assembly factor BamB